MKQIGISWQNITETDRNYFQDKADTDRIRYLEQMHCFYKNIQVASGQKEPNNLDLKIDHRDSLKLKLGTKGFLSSD
jgi:hypothetical protein